MHQRPRNRSGYIDRIDHDCAWELAQPSHHESHFWLALPWGSRPGGRMWKNTDSWHLRVASLWLSLVRLLLSSSSLSPLIPSWRLFLSTSLSLSISFSSVLLFGHLLFALKPFPQYLSLHHFSERRLFSFHLFRIFALFLLAGLFLHISFPWHISNTQITLFDQDAKQSRVALQTLHHPFGASDTFQKPGIRARLSKNDVEVGKTKLSRGPPKIASWSCENETSRETSSRRKVWVDSTQLYSTWLFPTILYPPWLFSAVLYSTLLCAAEL